MTGTDVLSLWMLSLPRHESGDEELMVLPRHTKVVVTGNNQTKSVLACLQGVVKKAVGLGGWHWPVLKNGMSVLDAPTGNEDDDEVDGGDNLFCGSFDMGEKDMNYSSTEYQKPAKPIVLHTRSWSSCMMSSSRVNLHSTSKLRESEPGKAWKTHAMLVLEPLQPCASPLEEQLFHGFQQRFQSQQLDELQVKRLNKYGRVMLRTCW